MLRISVFSLFLFYSYASLASDPKILIASFGVFSTGISVKAITNIVFVDSYREPKIIRQAIGRGLRLHKEKTKLIVFDLVDVFHPDYKTILWKQYESRRDELFKNHINQGYINCKWILRKQIYIIVLY